MADHIAALAGEVARRIAARLADLAPEMTTMFVDTIPEFHHDQAVQRLMVASTTSNLSAVVDMLMLGISLEDIAVPPAAAEYARRFAQHLRSTRGNNPGAGTSGQPTSASHCATHHPFMVAGACREGAGRHRERAVTEPVPRDKVPVDTR